MKNTWAYICRTYCYANLCSSILIAVPCHAWGIGLCLRSYYGISAHYCAVLMGSIFIIHWWLDCDCYVIFRWFLGCMYLFYRCFLVYVEVKFWIWYNWLLLVSSVAWNLCVGFCGTWFSLLSSVSLSTPVILTSLIGWPLSSVNINWFCSLQELCEGKVLWFIAGYLAEAGYYSVRHRGRVPTPSGDLFFWVKNNKSEPPFFTSTGVKASGAFGPWYLTTTGIFMLVYLEIMSNIEP